MSGEPAPTGVLPARPAPARPTARPPRRRQATPSAPTVPGWDALMIALALAMLSFVWRIQDLFPLLRPLQVPTISILAALGLALFGPSWGRRWTPVVKHPVARLGGVILILMMVSVPTSLYQGLSFRFVFQDHVKTLLLAALLVYAIRSWKDVERLAIVHLIGAALYSYVISTRFTVGSGGRLGRLLFYDANDISLLLVCCLPLGVYFLRSGSTRTEKLIASGVLAASLFTLVKTGSRGGFLGLIAVGVYLLLAYRAIPRVKRLASVGLLAGVFLVAAGSQYWELMESMLRPTQDYNWDSDSGRRKVWTRGVGYMLDNPLTGVGVAAFPVAEGTVSERAALQRYGIGFKWSAAHNSFVQIGAEIGVLGLLAFVAMLWVAIRRTYGLGRFGGPRAPPASPAANIASLGQAITGSLIGFCVVGFFLSHAYSVFLYSLLAMAVGLSAVAAAQLPLERRVGARVSPAPPWGGRHSKRPTGLAGSGAGRAVD